MEPTDLLLVIDAQNDFCPGGALEVADGDAVIPLINKLATKFANIALTQDWHPAGHASFASSHPGKMLYDQIETPYGAQTLWPDHCVQGTPGADFRADLDALGAAMIVRKGFRPGIDSYSAFFENDRKTPTGLGGALAERGFKRVYLCGLAYDFCVRFSAEDAVRLGFETIVIEDACRSVELPGTVEAAEESFAALGVRKISVSDLMN